MPFLESLPGTRFSRRTPVCLLANQLVQLEASARHGLHLVLAHKAQDLYRHTPKGSSATGRFQPPRKTASSCMVVLLFQSQQFPRSGKHRQYSMLSLWPATRMSRTRRICCKIAASSWPGTRSPLVAFDFLDSITGVVAGRCVKGRAHCRVPEPVAEGEYDVVYEKFPKLLNLSLNLYLKGVPTMVFILI
jgi:hypothetical protein